MRDTVFFNILRFTNRIRIKKINRNNTQHILYCVLAAQGYLRYNEE